MSIHRKAVGIWGSLAASSVMIALSLGGCESSEVHPMGQLAMLAQAQRVQEQEPEVEGEPEMQSPSSPGCNGTGYVMKMQNGFACPADIKVANGTWHFEKICDDAPYLPTDLEGLCSVTWEGNGQDLPESADANALQNIAEVASIAEDCVVNAPQSASPMQLAGPKLRDQFRKASGATNISSKPTVPAFVAVLDSLPRKKFINLLDKSHNLPSEPGDLTRTAHPPATDLLPFGRDDHGWLILSLMKDLMPHPDTFTLDAELALPQIDDQQVDTENGGYSGRQFHLANAICSAVATWQKQLDETGTDTRTAPAPVLVMALGSLPEKGQSYDSDNDIRNTGSLPLQTLYYAMQHAACHGAALVAAAGNDPNGDATLPACNDVSGAMCPGAMREIAAPKVEYCDGLYAKGSGYESRNYKVYNGPLHNPLVHTISAVDAAGKLLPITRQSAYTELAAMGELGAARDKEGVWHAARTGTSIATAVAGAAFATLFAYRPALTAAEAGDILVHSAQNSCSGPACAANDVNVISICRALEDALQISNQLECQAALDTQATTIIGNAMFDESGYATHEMNLVDSIPSLNLCPANWPLVNPAPGSTRCSDCGYLIGDPNNNPNPGAAYLRLEPGPGEKISDLTLVLRGRNPGQVEAFAFDAPLPNAGVTPLKFTNITSQIPAAHLRSVTFEAIVNGNGYEAAVSGEIPIFRQ